ncbi:MAG: hypothetical protein HPKKFMNG_00172 [Planctomycetes bacterium]|nr:hypothetical protein [Planctomycetota bacterium]HRJ78490.1 flagellar biosynthesis protein FliQ [Planctomycetota bacterium]
MLDQLQQATDVTNGALEMSFELAAPMLVAALVVGLVISIFQTATSIQDQTLSFVPKILVIGALLLLLFPWMSRTLMEYTEVLWRDVMPTFMVARPAGA